MKEPVEGQAKVTVVGRVQVQVRFTVQPGSTDFLLYDEESNIHRVLSRKEHPDLWKTCYASYLEQGGKPFPGTK